MSNNDPSQAYHSHRRALSLPVKVAAIVVVVLVAALAAVLVVPVIQSRNAHTASTMASQCPAVPTYVGLDSVSPVHNASSLSFPLLSMPSGSTGVICVSYFTGGTTGAKGTSFNLSGTLAIGNLSTTTSANGTSKVVFNPAGPGIKVTPSQTTLELGGSAPTHFTVAYTISTAATLRGFYFLDIQGLNPTGCADEFRFAVGYTFTGTNESGSYFSMPSGAEQCISAGVGFIPPVASTYSEVYSIQGMGVVYLSCGVVSCDVNQTA